MGEKKEAKNVMYDYIFETPHHASRRKDKGKQKIQKAHSCRTKYIHMYERGVERKNGIADNILSRKQHVKRNGTDYVNARREECL